MHWAPPHTLPSQTGELLTNILLIGVFRELMASEALRESSREYADTEQTEPVRVGARVCVREAHGEEQRLDCDGEMSPSTAIDEIELALLTAVEENEARGETDPSGVTSVDGCIAREAKQEGRQMSWKQGTQQTHGVRCGPRCGAFFFRSLRGSQRSPLSVTGPVVIAPAL